MLNNKHFQNILFCGYPAGSAFTAHSGRSSILTNEGREVHSQHSDIPSKHFSSQTAELGNSMCSPRFLCILSQFGSPFGKPEPVIQGFTSLRLPSNESDAELRSATASDGPGAG
jgi:hypothetical protein